MKDKKERICHNNRCAELRNGANESGFSGAFTLGRAALFLRAASLLFRAGSGALFHILAAGFIRTGSLSGAALLFRAALLPGAFGLLNAALLGAGRLRCRGCRFLCETRTTAEGCSQ